MIAYHLENSIFWGGKAKYKYIHVLSCVKYLLELIWILSAIQVIFHSLVRSDAKTLFLDSKINHNKLVIIKMYVWLPGLCRTKVATYTLILPYIVQKCSKTTRKTENQLRSMFNQVLETLLHEFLKSTELDPEPTLTERRREFCTGSSV